MFLTLWRPLCFDLFDIMCETAAKEKLSLVTTPDEITLEAASTGMDLSKYDVDKAKVEFKDNKIILHIQKK